MSPKHERDRLADLERSLERILTLAAGLTADQLAGDPTRLEAVLYNFVILGEAARHLPDSFAATHPDIPLAEMRRMRNFVAHVYFGVDPARLHQTISLDLPPALAAIKRAIAAAPPDA